MQNRLLALTVIMIALSFSACERMTVLNEPSSRLRRTSSVSNYSSLDANGNFDLNAFFQNTKRRVVMTDDDVVEIEADRFSILRAGAEPQISIIKSGAPNPNETQGSLTTGMFSFSNVHRGGGAPSELHIRNNERMVAEFTLGLSLTGIGRLPDPGPGGLAAIDIRSESGDESASVSTGAIVTVGGLGVGKSAHIGGNLAVLGEAYKHGGGAWASISDRRLKKNITPIENPLEKIERLRPVTFKWRNPSLHGGDARISGFIAQEVGEVFPEFIIKTKCERSDCALTGNDQVKAISLSTGFDAYVVGAIQVLAKRLSVLREKLHTYSESIETAELNADVAQVDELCIDGHCLDEAAFKRIIRQ